jgi:aminomethyltransferase
MSLSQTPLYALCKAMNARMTEFAGWEMPVQFKGIKQEHQAVRDQAGLFDISHMGKFILRGPGVIQALQKLVPSNLDRLTPGLAQYTVLLNPQGGIIDDLIIYLQSKDAGEESVVAIVNAATTDKDRQWIESHWSSPDGRLEDVSRDFSLLSLQGPTAVATLQQFTTADLSQVGRFGHVETTVFGQPAFLARTGYTGEDGFEIMTPAAAGRQLWQALTDQGVSPCGLGARDTLRLEAAMALYGQDIDDTTTPLEAGLGWLVHLDEKEDFIGRSALDHQKQNGLPRKLVGLAMADRHIARHGYAIMHAGEPVGTVTSGTLSPTLNRPIALGYVPLALAQVGQTLAVEVRGQQRPATVVKRPFYRAPKPEGVVKG